MASRDSEERIIPVEISDEMQASYLDYSMSVIVGRALPDARDGLKPVHRRILYGMYEMGIRPDSLYKKSARIVGDVMGKFHPHGDLALYDALVRMAQNFTMRYSLIDGQGNFGSVDGDPPAAMRYTEVRLTPIAMATLADIEKETVDFIPNFDNTMKEPTVLPTVVPNLLLNGSDGIAVGMATKIPPHNLTEVVDATISLIKNPDLGIKDLLKYISGPDFPTGGFIIGADGIKEAYKTGKGKIMIRAKVSEEITPMGKARLVISELPYQVNKAKLIEQIAELVRNKRLEGIADVRDESDREGLRLVIDVKRGEDTNILIQKLFKLTPLEISFGIIILALDKGRPRIMNLKNILEIFIEHRREVVTKRTKFLLVKAQERAHILEGLKIAVDNIDEIVKIISGSENVDKARAALISRFALSEKQAQAILDMRLSRLTALERAKIEEELDSTIKEIKRLGRILESPELLDSEIVSELDALKEKFGDERKTVILSDIEDVEIYEPPPEEDQVITITNNGYIKRIGVSAFKRLRTRIIHIEKGEESDWPLEIMSSPSNGYLLVFTQKGRCYSIRVNAIPEVENSGQKGKGIGTLLGISSEDMVSFAISVDKPDSDGFIVFSTEKGLIKRSDVKNYTNPKKGGIGAIGIEDGDRLVSGTLTTGENDIIITTKLGQVLRLSEQNIRASGRTAGGIKGIKLSEGDRVVYVSRLTDTGFVVFATENGYLKRVSIDEFPKKGRGSMGVKCFSEIKMVGSVIKGEVVSPESSIIISLSNSKNYQVPVEKIKILKRSAMGVKIKEVSGNIKLLNIIGIEIQ
jgi:DNA gyrase subunit A